MSSFLNQLPPSVPLKPGRYGADLSAPGVTVKRCDLSLATLVAGRGADAALAAAVQTAFGVALPTRPAYVAAGNTGFIGTGPGRWTVSSTLSPDALLQALEALGAVASATDQSDGAVVFELTGPKVRTVLAKLVNIDVDAQVFVPGSAATTQAALIGVTLWATDAGSIRVSVARSYAVALTRAIAAAAAECGFELQ